MLSQFSSPIILILLFAAGLSFYLEDRTDAFIIAVALYVASADMAKRAFYRRMQPGG